MKPKSLLREIFAILLLFASVLIFLSLLSYAPDDISFNTSSPNHPVVNKVGFLGAWSGFFLLFFFGFAAHAVPFVLFFLSLSLFKGDSRRKFFLKLASACGVLVALALFFSVHSFQTLSQQQKNLNI
ncbi:MAG: DNA translocase FtsK 4TM domain-containing protein, partial [Candidatus Aureabacteria bacterium]|nr:DNA translocase FtsK 4TM domain-containing protein [Candidatus Auribacterota bacterium]